MRTIGHFIGGERVEGTSGRTHDIYNPNTGEVQARVALAGAALVVAAGLYTLWREARVPMPRPAAPR